MIKGKENYDVVIIGAGISGLTSAALFSRFGFKVCVLEMDARPGGYVAGFRRKDFRFDSAIHWLNQCGPGGLVTNTFKMIGDDFPKAKIQKRIRRYRIGDLDYTVTNKPDQFKDQLIKDFPHEEKGIRKFFKDAKKIGKSFQNYSLVNRSMSTMNLFEKSTRGMKMLNFALPFIPHIRFHGDDGMKKGLAKYFKDEKLLHLFGAESDLLSCLIPISWAYNEDFQTPPPGGSQTYAEWLHHVVTEFGNDVLFQSKVSKIVIEEGMATGVEFERKGEINRVNCKYVIAACDVETLYEKMLPSNIGSEKMLKNLKGAELYASAITLSIGLDCRAEELGFGEEVVYIARQDVTRSEHGDGNPETNGIHVLASSVRDKSLAPEGKGTLTVFIPGFIEQYNNWMTETDEVGNLVRGEAYKNKKMEVSGILIKRIEEALSINLQDHIQYLDIATPVTHWRYTGNKGGTMMGARPGKVNMKAKVAHYKTPVPNVLLSGHWAELGGGIPVAIRASINSTLLVLKKENKKAFNLMSQYIDGKIDSNVIDKSDLTFPYANNWVQNPTPADKRKAKE